MQNYCITIVIKSGDIQNVLSVATDPMCKPKPKWMYPTNKYCVCIKPDFSKKLLKTLVDTH